LQNKSSTFQSKKLNISKQKAQHFKAKSSTFQNKKLNISKQKAQHFKAKSSTFLKEKSRDSNSSLKKESRDSKRKQFLPDFSGVYYEFESEAE